MYKYAYIDDRPTSDRRPTTDLSSGKFSNGHISATDRRIHFMIGSGSRWGFRGRRI